MVDSFIVTAAAAVSPARPEIHYERLKCEQGKRRRVYGCIFGGEKKKVEIEND